MKRLTIFIVGVGLGVLGGGLLTEGVVLPLGIGLLVFALILDEDSED